MIKKRSVIYYQDVFALICLILAVIFLCMRAPYGFGLEDESTYLTFPHRFLMGDAMISDEWSASQLFSVFLYLPVKLYVLKFGSTEGMILFFRYLFIAYQSAISIAIYYRFRKYGLLSIFSLLSFCLFVPATVMAICHYSIIAGLSELIGLLLSRNSYSRMTWYSIGLLFACLVICNMFFAAVYFMYFLLVFIFKVSRSKGKDSFKQCNDYLSIKTWFWITLGITTVALIFLIFLFSRTNIHEILKNLPHVFEDSEYVFTNSKGRKQNLISFKETVLGIININPYIFAAFALLMAVIIIDKNRFTRRRQYLIAASVVVTAYIIYLMSSSDFYKYLLCMFPLTLLGLICYILSENKNKKIFYFMWVWGIFVAFLHDIASDQGYKLMSLGLATSVTASMVFINNVIHEAGQDLQTAPNKHKASQQGGKDKKIIASVLVTVLLLQIGFECFIIADVKTVCAEYLYNNYLNLAAASEELDVAIKSGPAKGVMTTKTTANIYNNMLNDLSYIKNSGEGAVLILGKIPWAYLYVGNPYATYTTWYLTDRLPETLERLSEYYELHPEKKPVYIYIPKIPSLFISKQYLDQHSINFTTETLTTISKKYKYNVTEGKAGLILKVIYNKA